MSDVMQLSCSKVQPLQWVYYCSIHCNVVNTTHTCAQHISIPTTTYLNLKCLSAMGGSISKANSKKIIVYEYLKSLIFIDVKALMQICWAIWLRQESSTIPWFPSRCMAWTGTGSLSTVLQTRAGPTTDWNPRSTPYALPMQDWIEINLSWSTLLASMKVIQLHGIFWKTWMLGWGQSKSL